MIPILAVLSGLFLQAPVQEVHGPPAPPVSSFYWADLDADGDQDAVAVEAGGTLRVLHNGGSGSFSDVTQRSGLGNVTGVRSVLIGDSDLDGAVDLLLATAGGARSYRQTSGVFVEVTSSVGLAGLGPITSAGWVDANGDRRPDLHLSGNGVHRVFANEASGLFRELDLGTAASATATGLAGSATVGAESAAASPRSEVKDGPREGERGMPGRTVVSSVPAASDANAAPPKSAPSSDGDGGGIDYAFCPSGITDVAVGTCVSASSVPTLGMLYPLGNELFIDAVSGHVGIGTTSAPYRLTVAGQVVSGTGNTALGSEAAVGGGLSNTAAGDHSTVGGGEGNQALSDHTTISGGYVNRTLGTRSAIGGGVGNRAGNSSTVAGGAYNEASASYASVAGGRYNDALALASAVGGGSNNLATGEYAFVGGGGDANVAANGNTASGLAAVVPGGRANAAGGTYSLAAGRRAKALHDGSFVWGDSTDADMATTGPDQFIVRASGGVGIGTDTPTSPLTVEGAVESTTGGFVFPDGSLQATAGTNVPTGALIATESAVAPASYSATGWTVKADTGPDTWTARTPMTTPRSSFAAASVNGKVYVMGGKTTGSSVDSLEEYDPNTDSWTFKAPMPGGTRSGHVAAAVDGKVYVTGGYASGAADWNGEYDPATDTWATKAPITYVPIYAAAAVVDQKIYVMGGQGFTNPVLQAYDPATDTWTVKSNSTSGTWYRHSAAVLSGQIYFFGGLATSSTVLDRVERYDPAGDTWSQLGTMPLPAFASAAVVLDGVCFLMGGDSGALGASELDLVMRFDPISLWRGGASLPTPRYAGTAVTVNGKLYSIGGYESGTYLAELLEFEPGEQTLFFHKKD